MSRLTAIYEVELPRGLRAQRAEDDELSYRVSIGHFAVDVILLRNDGARLKAINDQHVTRLIEKIQLRVVRDEESEPPSVPRTESGGEDFGARSQWFGERKNDYAQTALTIVNRLIRFFKFRMRSPHLHEFMGHEDCFMNPIWRNENGESLQPGILECSGRMISPPGPALLGERAFTAADDSNFEESLIAGIIPKTYHEFLSDAQTSACVGNLPRAILEIAIACEVASKQLFFGAGGVTTSAFDYLEGRGRINIRVIELLDGVAKHTFGDSFKEANRDAFRDIDFLFRCRNKVAHKGEVSFRDDSGTKHEVNRQTLERWWASIDELMRWIELRKS